MDALRGPGSGAKQAAKTREREGESGGGGGGTTGITVLLHGGPEEEEMGEKNVF